MNGRTARALRQTAHEGAAKAVASLGPVIKGAFQNEEATRKRVEALEEWRGRGFLGRIRWLFLGK